jgi:aminopeptidase N
VHCARRALEEAIGDAHVQAWRALYAACRDDRFNADAGSMARRALRNVALAFLCAAQPRSTSAETMLVNHLGQAHNLTDRLAAMREIASAERIDDALRRRLLGEFYERWQHRKLVVDQWFTVQATAMRAGALDRVEALERHPAFDRRNPNRARALYGAFCNQNLVNFHALDGRGYAFLADRVIAIDGQNPQLAARLLVPMTRFRRYDVARQALMRAALTRIEASGPRSRDVHELVVKSLAGDQPVG